MKFFKYTLTFVLSIFIFSCDNNVNTENFDELEFEINLIELDSNRIKNETIPNQADLNYRLPKLSVIMSYIHFVPG